jgi:hypothetical protein
MVRRAVAGIVLLIVAVTAVTLLGVGTAAPADAPPHPPQTTPEGFTNAEFVIRVNRNGSARWTVRASRRLDNESDIERFRSFAETFETTETESFRDFRTRARRLVRFGTNATGREMNATRFERDARVVELGGTRGVVALSFLWTNFARTEDERVVVADVFEGGMYVGDGQRLVIARGAGLVFESVSGDTPPDFQSVEGNLTASETVTWVGERDFPDRRPRAVLVAPRLASTQSPAAGETGDTPQSTSSPAGPPTPGPDGAGGIGMLPFILAVVVLLGLGGGFALYSGAIGDIRGRPGSPGGGSGDRKSAAEPRAASGPAPDTPVPEEEPLSDEDRVMELLDENGGRMKQVNIVEETDWSKSKVSMLLSEMADDGQISKLRVGRENIISKAGEEPDAAGSPFDEE